MNTSPFTVEEIDTLQVVLDTAMREAAKQGIEVPVPVKLARLFAAASTGERNTEKPTNAVLNERHQLNYPTVTHQLVQSASRGDGR